MPHCRDPVDIPFLQLAIVGKADFLATGNGDLLSIKREAGCPIMTLDTLLAALQTTDEK